MKALKTITLVSVLALGMTTSVFASWWNPFTWFHKKVTTTTQAQAMTPITISPELQSIISMTSSTSLVDTRPVQYVLRTAPATTTELTISGITFSIPWSDLQQKKVTANFGIWRFDNKNVITVSVSTTTTKSIWKELPGIEKILQLDNLSDYDLEKMIWESDIHDAGLILSKDGNVTDNVRKGMLASVKARNYFTPEVSNKLLEFENQNGVKGLINIWKKDEQSNYYIVYFYPYRGYQYEMRFSAEQDLVMESIVNSINFKP